MSSYQRILEFFNKNKSVRYVFLLVTLCCCSNLVAQDLRDIGQLARDGAPGLALELLSQVQPSATENFAGWQFFERQRVAIMRDWSMWQDLVKRMQQFPQAAPAELQRWSRVEMANAKLQLGQGQAAAKILRELLWQGTESIAKDEFSLLRRLVIRSYLVDNNLADARRAMLRYEQDYGNKGKDWLLLRARVLLRSQRNNDARQLFSETHESGSEAQALHLLAQLRVAQQGAKDILGAARKSAQAKNTLAINKARLWKVAAEAASHINSHITHTKALEQAALLSDELKGDKLFKISGDMLWDAYKKYAMDEGNAMQLLIGQDNKWLAEADKWLVKRPQRARAFLSIVMFKAGDAAQRDLAYEKFTESVLKIDNGVVLLSKLFLDSALFPSAGTVHNKVRYILVDDALAKNDIELATRLMSGLQKAPDGADEFEWALRRARVLILGGRAEEGIAVLGNIIDGLQEGSKKTVDRVSQVIFDLQTVGQHEVAINLFDKLLKLSVDVELNRELFYWQADSYKALGKWPRAAQLYLQSATLLDGKGFDPWGQTARFRAAELLADQGVIEDSRRLYEGLLKITAEPSRRAVIRYKMQELWLKEQSTKDTANKIADNIK